MAQSTYILPTSGTLSGLSLCADVNSALESVATMNSGASAPPSGTWTTAVPAGAFWLNTSVSPNVIEIGDGTNWLTFGYLDTTNHHYTAAGPTGTYVDFAGVSTNLPPGCLLCYGQTVAIASYPNLFAKIGATYGGDGVTTFGIPDHRGYVRAGLDNMGGTAASRLSAWTSVGYAGGEQTHLLITAEMPSHNHTDSGHSHGVTDAGHAHQFGNSVAGSASSGGGNVYEGVSYPGTYTNPSTNASTTGITINTGHASLSSVGGGGAHNNAQPTLGVNTAIWI